MEVNTLNMTKLESQEFWCSLSSEDKKRIHDFIYKHKDETDFVSLLQAESLKTIKKYIKDDMENYVALSKKIKKQVNDSFEYDSTIDEHVFEEVNSHPRTNYVKRDYQHIDEAHKITSSLQRSIVFTIVLAILLLVTSLCITLTTTSDGGFITGIVFISLFSLVLTIIWLVFAYKLIQYLLISGAEVRMKKLELMEETKEKIKAKTK